MIAGFDVETSGLWRDKLPPDDPSQPHLLQIAAVVFDGRTQRRVRSFAAIIRPDGWTIEPGAEAVHGIDQRAANQCGLDFVDALAAFKACVSGCETLVAHNANFDRSIIDSALVRNGFSPLWWRALGGKMFCTQEGMTDVLKLPGQFGHKFPSLREAFSAWYPGHPAGDAHDAGADALKAAAIYFAMRGSPLAF